MTSSEKPGLASEPPEPLDVVETPTSPSSALALSRFEFETGKGNEGTKILMVEWDTSAGAEREDGAAGGDDWEISWDGKGTVLPIRDVDVEASSSSSSSSKTRRVYFLLPPGAPIPALVSIAHKGKRPEAGPVLRTKPMPAIFPAELTGKQDAGRRGVLHTIWARKRLAELQAEIAAEMRTNGESVGLEMALQERQWIVDQFGLGPDPGMPRPTKLHIPQSAAGPAGPKSPVGGRLGEKLRGLKLATSPADLAAASHAARNTAQAPQSLSSVGTRSFQPGSGSRSVGSLDVIVGTGLAPAAAANPSGGDTNEEDLFALPMSPRSPEMKRSPFSIL